MMDAEAVFLYPSMKSSVLFPPLLSLHLTQSFLNSFNKKTAKHNIGYVSFLTSMIQFHYKLQI